MSFSSWPRAGALFTFGLLAASCSENLTPDKKVAFIEIAPKSARLYTVGQQQQFETTLTTEAGTDGAGIAIGYKSRDDALVQVNSNGIATAKTKGGKTWIVATAGGKSDSAEVEVPLTSCGTTTATTMTVGQVVTDLGTGAFCATASTGDYAVIVHNNSLSASGSSSIEISGIAVGTAPAAGASLSKAALPASRNFGAAIRSWRRNVAYEMRHRRMEQTLTAPFGPTARADYAKRPRRASFATAAAAAAVGDVMRVNVNLTGAGCTDSTMINARVAAVSSTAIVLADPGNPATGGFTDQEYNEFAQMFDSVINPLDVAQFGAPTDIDANGKVILVFTKAVNLLTPPNQNSYIGGLTYSRDLVLRNASPNGCPASNQAELFYLLVPDSTGSLGNAFEKGFVKITTDVTIAHEYQHLINFARRRYLNATTPQPFEELWLNEGLSHMAEGLLYYRRTGRTPRQNIGGPNINTTSTFNQFLLSMYGNWANYDEYVFRPTSTSPFEAGDDVATRGASWAFLRYCADQMFTSDGTFWYNLVNSGETGLTNLQNRLGVSQPTLLTMFRDFVISNYTDDYVTGIAAKYTQSSWNMRSVYPIIELVSGQKFPWPLVGAALKDNQAESSTLQAGAFQVFRFRGLVGTDSYVRVTGPSGTALPSGITFSVVRTQ
jgi:hypothetical protein